VIIDSDTVVQVWEDGLRDEHRIAEAVYFYVHHEAKAKIDMNNIGSDVFPLFCAEGGNVVVPYEFAYVLKFIILSAFNRVVH
jgi:hypothetical protein